MAGCAQAYLLSLNAGIKTGCDDLYAGLYGGLGGPDTDSNYVWQLIGRWDSNFTTTFDIAKNYGFIAGWGGGAAWPAASAGGLEPENIRTVYLGFDAAEVPGAVAVGRGNSYDLQQFSVWPECGRPAGGSCLPDRISGSEQCGASHQRLDASRGGISSGCLLLSKSKACYARSRDACCRNRTGRERRMSFSPGFRNPDISSRTA